jgi:hypothetical protein
MRKNLSKRTSCGWRHPWPGDTWHVPPGPVPVGPCRRSHRRHVAWLGGSGHVAACRHPHWRQALLCSMPPPPLAARPWLCASAGSRGQGATSSCRHRGRRQGPPGRTNGRAGNGNGGRGLPALAQAARATCRLARGAATRRGSFLTKNFAGGLF